MKSGILLLRNTKIKLSQGKIAKRRKQIARLKKLAGSWRSVQRDYYPDVSFQTLGRFATSKYVPSSLATCLALDILQDPPSPYRSLPKWYKRTPEALDYFNRKREQIKHIAAESRRQSRSYKLPAVSPDSANGV